MAVGAAARCVAAYCERAARCLTMTAFSSKFQEVETLFRLACPPPSRRESHSLPPRSAQHVSRVCEGCASSLPFPAGERRCACFRAFRGRVARRRHARGSCCCRECPRVSLRYAHSRVAAAVRGRVRVRVFVVLRAFCGRAAPNRLAAEGACGGRVRDVSARHDLRETSTRWALSVGGVFAPRLRCAPTNRGWTQVGGVVGADAARARWGSPQITLHSLHRPPASTSSARPRSYCNPTPCTRRPPAAPACAALRRGGGANPRIKMPTAARRRARRRPRESAWGRRRGGCPLTLRPRGRAGT